MPDQARDIVEGLTKPLERLVSEHDVTTLHGPLAGERTCRILHTNDAVATQHIAAVTGIGKAHIHESAVTLPLQVPRHELPQHLVCPEARPAGRHEPCTKERAT